MEDRESLARVLESKYLCVCLTTYMRYVLVSVCLRGPCLWGICIFFFFFGLLDDIVTKRDSSSGLM